MKKTFALLLIVSFFALSMSGCASLVEDLQELNSPEEYNAESIVPIDEYDNETVFYPDENGNDESGEPQNEGITLKDKKYTFEGKDLVIINARNQTSTNYEVTVTGSYLDKDGKVLKTETQTFDQFAVDYQHYFLFNPEINFEKFTYTLDVKETTATMYVNDIEFVFAGLQEAFWPIDELAEKGDLTPHPLIQSLFGYKNISEDKSLGITVEGNVVLFNENNEIVAVYGMRSLVFNTGETQFATHPIYHTLEEELVWPDEFKGEIRPLHATTRVVPKNN